jgi:Ser/Thr protein kinase RdoA (MazF antagonist)
MNTAVAVFSALSPERVLEAVECGLRCRCTGLLRPLPSYINRVYTVELETGETVVAKFYRPGRWTRAAIIAEHDLVLACAADEIPVIAPLPLADNKGTVGDADGIAFALYPRRGGRPIEPAEPADALWGRLGALLARVHRVGARAPAPDRLTLHPLSTTTEDLAYLLDSGFLEAREAGRLEAFAAALFERIVPQFEELGGEVIRLHGDCQHTNVLERPETGLFLIDFDDMMNGTPVQDLWMLLPGRAAECAVEWAQMIEGYETFRAFDRRTVRLIEPLRAMRMIYYLAWCARQAHDASFRQNHPDWGTRAFWVSELAELETQLGVIGQDVAHSCHIDLEGQ